MSWRLSATGSASTPALHAELGMLNPLIEPAAPLPR